MNFLDGGGLKAAGAIATFVSQSQTRYLQWDNNSLRQLMTQVGRYMNIQRKGEACTQSTRTKHREREHTRKSTQCA